MTEPAEADRGSNLPQPYRPPAGPTALQTWQGAFEPEAQATTLAYVQQVLIRRKWLISAAALTVVLLAILQVFTATPLYNATATIQIDPEGQNILPYEEIDTGVGQLTREEYLWTQAEKLQTRELARRVVRQLDLANVPAFADRHRRGVLVDALAALRSLVRPSAESSAESRERLLTRRLLSHLQVRPLRSTRLIEVSFDAADPKLAAAVTNTIVEQFIEQHLEGKFEATTRATQFLEQQLAELQVRVEESEQDLLRYAQQRDIVNLSDRDTIARKRLADLNDELTAAEGELIEKRARFPGGGGGVDSFPEVLETEAIRGLRSRISEIESELAGLSSRYGPEWPRIKGLRSEIRQLEVQLVAEKELALVKARDEYLLAADRQARLEAKVDEQRGLVDQLNQDTIQYNILKRDSDSNKELYEGLLQRLKEAGVAAGLRSSNLRVADPAAVPSSPSSPNKPRSLGLALILGLFFGCGLAFLVEAVDTTVKSSDNIPQLLGLPSLGVVPHFEVGDTRRGWARLRARHEARPPILVAEDQRLLHKNRVMEAYRSVRTSILLSHSGNPPQTILITSALPREGKTTTAANTAMSLAQTGKRTLLIELDLRKPGIGQLFELPTEEGMSTYLSGNTDLSSQIRQTRRANLYAVVAGPIAPNPVELLGSERMDAGLRLVREYFTYIIIDSPPALELSDALLLAPRVDGVIVVARSGVTPRKALVQTGAQIRGVGGLVLGVLMNDVDPLQPGYGDYYGSYGSYFGQEAGEPSGSA